MTFLQTESVRYAGSKAKITNKIIDLSKTIEAKKVLDGFSGSGRVAQAYKVTGHTVHANDSLYFSKIINECYLLNRRDKSYYQKIIDHLNNIQPKDGWFTDNYGGHDNNGSSVQKDGLKRPWQIHNTRKLDAIRDEIDSLYPNDHVEKSVLLTSLLLGLDKVLNDMGHHTSYLKDWSKKTYSDLLLKVPRFHIDDKNHKVLRKDIFSIDEEYDLAYLDPPYGTANQVTVTSRVRYFSYYHLWTTVCKYDKPKLFGAALRREDASSDTKPGAISVFESTKKQIVKDAFIKLIGTVNAGHYIISYSNRGKVPIAELIELLNDVAIVENIISFKHTINSQANTLITKKYKTKYDDDNMEFLFLLKHT